jgi:hypothetical protein
MDLPEAAVNLKAFRKKHRGLEIFPMCAELGEGISELKSFLQIKVAEQEELEKSRLAGMQPAVTAI